MKRGAPDHPKTFALAEALGIRRVHAVGILEMLFHFTSQYAPQGDIGRFTSKRIAAAVDWHGKPDKLISALVETGWIDTHPEVKLVVHDWHDHADRTTLQRLTRQGKSAVKYYHGLTGEVCTQSETDSCTPPVPEPVPIPKPEPVPHHNRTNASREDAPGQQDLGVALVSATVIDFREWIKPWQRCKDPGEVAEIWKVTVLTQGDIRGAFDSRDRYLASDEVARNIIMAPDRFLAEQKKAKWMGIWPAARRGATNAQDRMNASRATTLAVMDSTQKRR